MPDNAECATLTFNILTLLAKDLIFFSDTVTLAITFSLAEYSLKEFMPLILAMICIMFAYIFYRIA